MLQNFHFSFDQWRDKRQNRTVFIVHQLSAFFIRVVHRWDVEVDDCVDVFEHRAIAVASVEHHNYVELSDVEEMDY